MSKIKETLPFAVEQSAKYPVAIIDRNGDYIAEEVSDDDAQFIVTTCNYHERLKNTVIDLLEVLLHYESGGDSSDSAKSLLKELEESCKEK